ncbi:MFS transporter [uncultured Gimesia sp.]|uniref:MFS transporter n=1 Tax=uncultured Gimesia sp. TaxID=1678688 RepID=UPI0026043754|nr:MFS transporter [uncultured Gimesia sp.]
MSLDSENHDTLHSQPTNIRFLVVGSLGLGFLLAYLPRAGISPMVKTIQADLFINDADMGHVLAVFFAGYFFFQIPGGLLGQKWGNRIALPLLQLMSALANVLTAVAYSLGFIWFSRFLLGLAQAGMVPCSAQVIKNWIPESQRGTASSLMGSFMSVGSVIATGLTAVMIEPFGWRVPLIMFSIFSVCWAILFFLYFRDRPANHPYTNSAEVELIGQPEKSEPLPDEAGPEKKSSVALEMLANRSVWFFCLQSIFRAFGYAFFITWYPTYLQNSSGASIKEAGLLTMLTLMGVVLGTLTGGKLIDVIYKRTGNKYSSRSLLCVVSHLLCALCILLSAWLDPALAVYLIVVGTFLSGIGNPSSWVTSMDLGGARTSIVIATMNMAGVIGAYSSPIVVGKLFEYIKDMPVPNWNLVLFLFAGIYLLATLCWACIDPDQRLSE